MSYAGKWGPYPPYEIACAKLLANLSEGLPLPHFWMLEENAQKVAVAVIDHTSMSLEKWDRLTPPERVVWVDKANEVVAKLRVTEESPSQEATVKDVKPSTNPAAPSPEPVVKKPASVDARALAEFIDNPSLSNKEIAKRIGAHEKSVTPRRCPKLAAARAAYKAPEMTGSVRRGSKVHGLVEAEDE